MGQFFLKSHYSRRVKGQAPSVFFETLIDLNVLMIQKMDKISRLSMKYITIPGVPYIFCHMYLVPLRSPYRLSWLLLTWMIPAEQKPSMGTGPACYSSCMTFFSEAATQDCTASSCYPFMTTPARLVTDVCNTSSVKINCFT